MARIEVLTDIPSDEVEQVVADYESEGALVEKLKQPDGNWTVRATFKTDSNSKNEGELDCCSHAIHNEAAVPDEDLPAAVGGIE